MATATWKPVQEHVIEDYPSLIRTPFIWQADKEIHRVMYELVNTVGTSNPVFLFIYASLDGVTAEDDPSEQYIVDLGVGTKRERRIEFGVTGYRYFQIASFTKSVAFQGSTGKVYLCGDSGIT